MFLGLFKHSIDAKGRLNIPKRFLEPFADASRARMFYATKGLDGCIFLFLAEEWQRVVEQVRSASLGSGGARGFARSFFTTASELAVDGSGRILLPKQFREIAEIESEVVIAGVDQRIELWSPPRWDRFNEGDSDDYEEQAKEIFRV